jgi:hypothetical protein
MFFYWNEVIVPEEVFLHDKLVIREGRMCQRMRNYFVGSGEESGKENFHSESINKEIKGCITSGCS